MWIFGLDRPGFNLNYFQTLFFSISIYISFNIDKYRKQQFTVELKYLNFLTNMQLFTSQDIN